MDEISCVSSLCEGVTQQQKKIIYEQFKDVINDKVRKFSRPEHLKVTFIGY